MAQEFSKSLYHSKLWERVVKQVRQRDRTCVHCLAHGDVTAGEEVHHVIELAPENINNFEIAYGLDNLILLCKSCHNKAHERFKSREFIAEGFTVDERGDYAPLKNNDD